MSQFSDIQVRQALVTPQGSLTDHKGAKDGVAFVDAVHGEYYATAITGRLFRACNQAAVATSTTKNTTWTGLGVANPTTSKLYILRRFMWMATVVLSAAGGLSLVSTTSSGLATNIVPECAQYSAGASTAIVDDGATVVAGNIICPVSTYGTGAITTWQGSTWQTANIDGAIIIPPGRAILTDTTTATTASFVFGFLWEEVDIV